MFNLVDGFELAKYPLYQECQMHNNAHTWDCRLWPLPVVPTALPLHQLTSTLPSGLKPGVTGLVMPTALRGWEWRIGLAAAYLYECRRHGRICTDGF